MRLAIVGAGPRGLFALERLLVEVASSKAAPALAIDVFEPHPAAGAGPVYDPSQPDYLRMNFAAKHVDLWSRDLPVRPLPSRPDLLAWLRRRHPRWADGEAFVPRSQVGEYLAESYRAVVAALIEEGVMVRRTPAAVRTVERCGDGWSLLGDALPAAAGPYDEVLLCLGHAAGRRDDFRTTWEPEVGTFVDRVFPIEALSEKHVGAGSRVAIRGFALTWIDATLALFEGRGGRFEPAAGDEVGRYLPAADEVTAVWPFSRTGRPMTPKPDPLRIRQPPGLEPLWRAGRERLLAAGRGDGGEGRGLDLERHLVAALVETAAEALRRAGEPHDQAPTAARGELRSRLAGGGARTAASTVREMRRALAVAVGRRPVDAAWALGESWRQLYPAVVERVGHGGLPVDQRPAFARLAAELERLAFGPPVVNVSKVLALIDAGRVSLDFIADPTLSAERRRLRLTSRDGARSAVADALVDAVLPAAGCDREVPVLGPLLRAGHLRRHPGTAGLETTEAARAIGRDGQPTPGLAVVGRAVEGCVIGHDTLSRTLHGELDRWAAAAVRAAPHLEARWSA